MPAISNNDVLRRVRYAFDLSDTAMIEIFGLGGREATRAEVSDWLKRDDDPAFEALPDVGLARFLNGFIVHRRGAREGGPPEPETELSNNIVLNKLKIALALQADDVLALVCRGDVKLSRHELSAFFRRPGHKHYRPCMDQVLRNFLQGLQAKYRPTKG